jgi:hypothetical protein
VRAARLEALARGGRARGGLVGVREGAVGLVGRVGAGAGSRCALAVAAAVALAVAAAVALAVAAAVALAVAALGLAVRARARVAALAVRAAALAPVLAAGAVASAAGLALAGLSHLLAALGLRRAAAARLGLAASRALCRRRRRRRDRRRLHRLRGRLRTGGLATRPQGKEGRAQQNRQVGTTHGVDSCSARPSGGGAQHARRSLGIQRPGHRESFNPGGGGPSGAAPTTDSLWISRPLRARRRGDAAHLPALRRPRRSPALAGRLVPHPLAPPALARRSHALPRLGLGDHAPADPGRHGAALLRALRLRTPRHRQPRPRRRVHGDGPVGWPRLLPPGSLHAPGRAPACRRAPGRPARDGGGAA